MGSRTRVDVTGRRLLLVMLGVGAALGLGFPVFASFFVTFNSSVSTAAFTALCVAAGVGVAMACWRVVRSATRSMIVDILDTAGSTLNMSIRETGSIGEARSELQRVLDNVTTLLGQVKQANIRLRGLAADIMSAAEEQVSGAAEQSASVTETSATVEELALTSKQIAENSEAVVRVAERTLASAEEGMSALADTANGIDEIGSSTMQASDRILALGERSQEIGRVLVIIDEIAEQTKILALNAAIEAARAGEAGKGFAVVAGEIRKLADSVTESTQEISRVVREIQSSTSALVMSTERSANVVQEGKDLAMRTASALDRIVQQVEETNDAAKQISVATQQQRTASDQVVVSMKEVALVSQQHATSARQVSGAVSEMNDLADSLVTG